MNSLQEIWESVLALLGAELTPTAMNTWFSECSVVELSGNQLVIHTPSEFKRDIIVQRYAETISRALSDLFSAEMSLLVLAGEEIEEYREKKTVDDPFGIVVGDYTFDNFVVGPTNRIAHAAALAVSKNPGWVYNPLLIYGNSGLGKTHLLLAIGQYIHENFPEKKIIYIKGDDFTNDMVHSIQTHTQSEFREKYRTADLLLMDDIQFIAGKQQTQEEWFHTFNALYESHKAIVLTSDRPPMEMKTLEDRIRSRLEGGMLADVQPPDLETRMAITRNKAQLLGMVLPGDVVEFIAENITSNIRQLEGVVKRLTAYREILGEEITVESVRRAIKDVIRVGAYVPTADIIITETARYFGLEEEHLRGQSRAKEVATPRQVAMYLCRTLPNISLEDIGAQFGNRNHSTVLSSIRKIEKLVRTDSNTANIIRDITSNINSKS